MNFGMIAVCCAGCGAAAYAIWRVHHLCLWLEEQGWIYYRHKQASSTAAGCLVAVQQAIEPRTRHVIEVMDHQKKENEGEIPGVAEGWNRCEAPG
jgi:hypothetical protein